MSGNSKIFGIGLNKTGTTTLNICGNILGLQCSTYDLGLVKDVIRNDYSRLKRVVEQNDLFEDWPYPLIYKELDEMLPGSKFILTVRKNERKWLESLKKHTILVKPLLPCNRWAYGYYYPHGHEQGHIDVYNRHNEEVRNYFKDRPDDFLEICWENGDGWEKLCSFLGKDIPDESFPHANKAGQIYASRKRKIVNQILCRLLSVVKV
ncbi:MAG: hypothetical protein H6868_03925 [Rhodospirillales bacterium]|nr:hypothetical protein [Rhodospirillales bacterium]